MKKFILLMLALCFPIFVNAQLCSYQHLETLSSTSEEVTFNIKVFCNDKKFIDQQANLASIRCVIFEGIPNTRFSKPLLSEGEQTMLREHPDYFDDLYNGRCSDFIKQYRAVTKFKKSGDKKSTIYEVTVMASKLRKDLEKNNIKKKLGI